MKKQMTTHVLVIAALAVVLNIIGGTFVELTKIPLLFLDTIGTTFSAVLVGPWVGALVGLVSNLVNALITGDVSFVAFSPVNIMVGVVVGWIARKWGFNLLTAIITGFLLSVLCPLVGSPIAVALYGGMTGSGTDLIVLWLTYTGQRIFAATFISRITANLVDKIASTILVWAIGRALPAELTAKFTNSHAA